MIQERVQMVRITERRGGKVFQTEFMGEVWVKEGTEMNVPQPRTEIMFVPLSTERMKQLGFYGCFRRKEMNK